MALFGNKKNKKGPIQVEKMNGRYCWVRHHNNKKKGDKNKKTSDSRPAEKEAHGHIYYDKKYEARVDDDLYETDSQE
ncbi:hypothetical protein DIS24_g5321 [Lasiodiplodia hormozganensis]|uniref:Uncharacterized protein n=1 Tax=Lasiodiplodia hormozganensis TaxID=869390 RepID=A0AA39YKM6_9PEZI|nr:hypothetical protein DIS24_g5321 [Lasiodiplodia hormozganensis]